MRRKPRRRRPNPFSLEPLETRWVMAASLSLTGPTGVVYEGNQAELTLTLSERSRLPEAVEIRTVAASATQGYDYIHRTQRVTFFPGETSKRISISTLQDAGVELVEGIETFTVIATPANAALGTRTATIQVADFIPPPSISVDDVEVTEGNNGTTAAVFSVSLSKSHILPVSVTYSTRDETATTADSDYVAASGTLNFAPGETSATVSIDVVSDTNKEYDETFSLVLSSPVNATIQSNGLGTIINDDGEPPVELPGFQITVNYLTDPVHGEVTQPVVDAVTQAVVKWQSIITGDISSFVNPFNDVSVDDIQLDVRMGLLGTNFPTGTDTATGRNVIANAGPLFGSAPGIDGERAIRDELRLPYWGTIGFDPANAAVDPATELYETALHEIGHALGFGNPLLFVPRAPDYPEGLVVGTLENPVFIGRNAIREYNEIFSTAVDNIPMENEGGGGTILVHWEETILPGELMNGTASPGINPLSKVTVGAMADLGYVVNYVAADPYPAPRTAAQTAAQDESTPSINSIIGPAVSPQQGSANADEPTTAIGPTFTVARETIPIGRKLPTRITFPDRASLILVNELREAVATSLTDSDGPIDLRGISPEHRSMLIAWAAYGQTSDIGFAFMVTESSPRSSRPTANRV